MVTRRQSSKFKSQSSRSRSKVKSFKIILINSKLHTHDSSNILNIIDVTKGQRSKVRESKVKVKGHKSKVNFPILVQIRSKLQRSDFCNILLRFEVKGYVRYQKDFAKCTCLRVSTIFSSCIWQQMLPNALFLPHFFFLSFFFWQHFSNDYNIHIIHWISTKLCHNS